MRNKSRTFTLLPKLSISPTVYALSFGSFFNDIASEMIIPLIPIFLSTIPQHPL